MTRFKVEITLDENGTTYSFEVNAQSGQDVIDLLEELDLEDMQNDRYGREQVISDADTDAIFQSRDWHGRLGFRVRRTAHYEELTD